MYRNNKEQKQGFDFSNIGNNKDDEMGINHQVPLKLKGLKEAPNQIGSNQIENMKEGLITRSKLEKGERRRAITDAWSTRNRRTGFEIKTPFQPPIKSWPRYTQC